MDKKISQIVNEIRYISATAISNAGSGHTGICMGAAPILFSLYNNILKSSAAEPSYFNRDRFVLDAGHAVPLLYSVLNLYGYDITIEDLKNLRKMNSKTKGHISCTIPNLGIDASGGPLGQGLPMAVGMAIAESKLAKTFNKKDFKICDHYTYCLVSDGGIMEGITNEASSLAGTLGLSKLIVLYDSNNITIEGNTDLAFTENVMARYNALGWNTIEVEDGNDVDSITRAISFAKAQNDKPTIIKINTHIGFGTDFVDSCKIHGKALTKDELNSTKKMLDVNTKEFIFSQSAHNIAAQTINKNYQILESEKKLLNVYKNKYPKDYEELNRWLSDYYSKNFDFNKILYNTEKVATRIASKYVINEMAKKIPNLIVGSADLAPSTGVVIDGGGDYAKNCIEGRNVHFGIREHAMGSICNGIALHGGFRIICSTFMVFSDYLRHAIRMSALMNVPVIYCFSHDSIGVGEDGSTHQPIEYNTMYRATPNVNFIRPADIKEVAFAYETALLCKKPTIIATTRQKVECLIETDRTRAKKGGYLLNLEKEPDVILMSSGSEVCLIIEAGKELNKLGIKTSLISFPCMNIFDQQSNTYKDKILPPNKRLRVSIESGSGECWYKYVGLDGCVIDIKRFGKTGDTNQLFEDFGITRKNVVQTVKNLLNKKFNS